jgi:hypothetical protein
VIVGDVEGGDAEGKPLYFVDWIECGDPEAKLGELTGEPTFRRADDKPRTLARVDSEALEDDMTHVPDPGRQERRPRIWKPSGPCGSDAVPERSRASRRAPRPRQTRASPWTSPPLTVVAFGFLALRAFVASDSPSAYARRVVGGFVAESGRGSGLPSSL